MQNHDEKSVREPTVQRADQDVELARVEQRRSSAWIGFELRSHRTEQREFYVKFLATANKNRSGGWSEVHLPLSQEV